MLAFVCWATLAATRLRAVSEADSNEVTLGVARAFNDEAEQREVSFGNGHWRRFGQLDSYELYEKGQHESYDWRQNAKVVEVFIPSDCSRADVRATITPTRLAVAAPKEEPPLLDGALTHRIDPELSYWYLEEGFLIVELVKEDEFYNWVDVFKEPN